MNTQLASSRDSGSQIGCADDSKVRLDARNLALYPMSLEHYHIAVPLQYGF